jgi:hypothetical protein
MADVILLVLGAAISLIILVYVIRVGYQARGSRPVTVELSQANTEVSAKTVDLGPYVEFIGSQFPHTLGI